MSKSHPILSITKCLLLALAGIFIVQVSSAKAQYACGAKPKGIAAYTNPCPAKGDMVLPMPGGLSMVFRSIRVPGPEFWGNPERNVEMGDPSLLIFEGPRLVSVSGSFLTSDRKNWRIIIGKYEATIGQYAVVFGNGDLDAGMRKLSELSGGYPEYSTYLDPGTSPIKRARILSHPATGLVASDHIEFAKRYTDWCFKNAKCRAALPQFGNMPGFFRQPTEIEWEYAARNGGGRYASRLPFEEAEATKYAYVSTSIRERSNPTSIGRLKPVSGLYDLYGNVDELADGRFYAELGQGKPGMYIARGGSYAYQPDQLRPSLRREVQSYRLDDAGVIQPLRSQRLGARLAIGSQTVPNSKTLRAIEKSYASYKSSARLNSAAASSTKASLLAASQPLDQIDALLSELAAKTTGSNAIVEDIAKRTKAARLALTKTTDELASQLVRNALRSAAEAGRSQNEMRKASSTLKLVNNAGLRDKLERKLQYYERVAANSTQLYIADIRNLASYRDFSRAAIKRYEALDLNPLDAAGLSLTKKHVEQLLQGKAKPKTWSSDISTMYSNPAIFSTQGR
jgi:Sulfatase-modifying factor enzyme 1